MTITEIAIMNLRDGVTRSMLTDPEGEHAWCLATLSAQPGLQHLAWGVTLPGLDGVDPQQLFWFVEWDDKSSHQKFMDSDIYADFVANIPAYTNTAHPDGPIIINHYNFPTPPSAFYASALAADITPKVEYISVAPETHLTEFQRHSCIAPPGILHRTMDFGTTFDFAVEDYIFTTLCFWHNSDQRQEYLGAENVRNWAEGVRAPYRTKHVVMTFLEILG
ncbi:hypothetical protein DRE_06437 [Drechslerella stenobrocha 248]|uniref:ABM domain-containing protein n=1 Tax=Drechslerella stenobrocha 248 TaxID=1043628 RepID=W7HNT8_9PEZI|nr:hypothetical protein DRE_06437 [Drechslerella stenobrocha 248]